MLLLGVLIGGALGALTRYWATLTLQGWLAATPYASFPLGTLVVNVVGSFLLSFLAAVGLGGAVPPAVRLALGTGFLGAMTTFSTFEFEADALLRSGEVLRAALFVMANLILGYAAIVLGRLAAAPLALES
jgi:CrcB protein